MLNKKIYKNEKMKNSIKIFLCVLLCSSANLGNSALKAQSNPMLGQIIPVAFNFAPVGWAKCEGQILPISQNEALFSILGNTYGGDGRTTFALPDLRGRVIIGPGQGPGLTLRRSGDKGGAEIGGSAGTGNLLNGGMATSGFDNMQPFNTVTYIIALQGYYPSRN